MATATIQTEETEEMKIKTTEQAIRGDEGKIVRIIANLEERGKGCFGTPREMLCAGITQEGNYLFMEGVLSTLDGKNQVWGLCGERGYTFFEPKQGYVLHLQGPGFPKVIDSLGKEDNERALKLWNGRNKQ